MKKQIKIGKETWDMLRIRHNTKLKLLQLKGQEDFITFDQVINWLLNQNIKY
jgi:hypothetical protein